MKGPLVIIVLVTAVLTAVAFVSGGIPLMMEGFVSARNTALSALPLIIASFIAIGQFQALLSSEKMSEWIEKYSGFKGIIISAVAGGFFPGPPYVYYPFLATFKEKELPFYMFFSFIVGKQIYDVVRLPMEISLISPGLALLRNIITLPMPILMGLWVRHRYPQEKTSTYFEGEEL